MVSLANAIMTTERGRLNDHLTGLIQASPNPAGQAANKRSRGRPFPPLPPPHG